MGDLTPNLSVREFSCQCKNPDCKYKKAADMKLALMLQDVCDHFKYEYKVSRVSIKITGGNRCRPHNIFVQMKWSHKSREEAEASISTHMDLIAADFKIYVYLSSGRTQVPPQEIYDYLDNKYPDSCGLGIYNNRNHADPRPIKARW